MATVKSQANQVLGVVIVAVIAAIVMGAVLPVGVDQFLNAETSGWPTGVAALFDTLLYFIIILPFAALASMVVDMF